MKLRMFALTLAVCGLLVSVPASASVWLADYLGYDYTWPLAHDFTSPGQYYDALGSVVSTNPTFVPTFPGVEYTFHIYSGTSTYADTLGNFGIYRYEAMDGSIGLYGDLIPPGSSFDYGTNPPNGVAPATFIDGTLLLGATFDFLQITVDLTTGDGSLSGTLSFNSGSDFGNIPGDMLNGWTFAGLGAGFPGIPDGYSWQIDGEIYLPDPTATEESSWGGIKKLFN